VTFDFGASLLRLALLSLALPMLVKVRFSMHSLDALLPSPITHPEQRATPLLHA
jgi:hypothetical protein